MPPMFPAEDGEAAARRALPARPPSATWPMHGWPFGRRGPTPGSRYSLVGCPHGPHTCTVIGGVDMTIATELAQAPSGLAAEGVMHAFVMGGLEQVGFMQKPIPRPGPLDAIVRTTRALICTSDAHTVHGP